MTTIPDILDNFINNQSLDIEKRAKEKNGEIMKNKELKEWLRANSSGIYRPAREAAELIERLEIALGWYVQNDDVNLDDPTNQYYIEGRERALKELEQ